MRRFLLLSTVAIGLLIAAKSHAQQGAQLPAPNLLKPISLPKKEVRLWPGSEVATSHLGFFCRQEIRADKKLPLPLRFRVGSIQQADWLESKPNAQRPEK